jgi:hypothetical protein
MWFFTVEYWYLLLFEIILNGLTMIVFRVSIRSSGLAAFAVLLARLPVFGFVRKWKQFCPPFYQAYSFISVVRDHWFGGREEHSK